MTNYRLTPAAQRDLSAIWDFTEERWDRHQAEIYLREIQEAVERIASNPERGRPCSHIRHGYRRYSIGSHLIFYVERERSIDIIRILHQRMDPTRHM
ncbi:type II toxin-antitoxin system RelE/ParE family toxin [Jonesiaceae bacterium BS-20]|uniref:Toxin n=1 Tax=Jonesiaceae bacterium BS-20 TaxID=3120821 RepID=A0AAU7DWZ7_9MICO